jgi:hypothetical protein
LRSNLRNERVFSPAKAIRISFSSEGQSILGTLKIVFLSSLKISPLNHDLLRFLKEVGIFL